MTRREKIVYAGGGVLAGLFAGAMIVNAVFLQPPVDVTGEKVRLGSRTAESGETRRVARTRVQVRVDEPRRHEQARPASRMAVRHTASIDPAPSYSPLIAQVQQRLARMGYDPGMIDGRLGPATRAAIRRFQKANNLPPTGEPDAGLLALLLP